MKFGASPLEAMILVASFPGGQGFELDIIFYIGRRYCDCTGPGELKKNPLKGCQAWRVQVLDYLHHGGGIVSLQAFVAVGQRAVDQRDALFLFGEHALYMQPTLRQFQGAIGNVQAQNLLEGPVL